MVLAESLVICFIAFWVPSNYLALAGELKSVFSTLNALADILHCLITNQLPTLVTFPQFSNMSLKFRTVQVFAPHAIVALVESNTMIVYRTGSIDCPLEVAIPFVTVEFQL